MNRSLATVRVRALPQLAPGAVRVEVACRHSLTRVTQAPVPGGFLMSLLTLTTFVTYRHEEECGRCDTSAAHAKGDQRVRDLTEQTWSQHQAEQARQYVHGRRN